MYFIVAFCVAMYWNIDPFWSVVIGLIVSQIESDRRRPCDCEDE